MHPPHAFGTNPSVDGSEDLLTTNVHAWPARHFDRTTHCHVFSATAPDKRPLPAKISRKNLGPDVGGG